MLINKTGSACQSGGQRQILIRRSFSDCLVVCGGRAHSEQVTERSSRSVLWPQIRNIIQSKLALSIGRSVINAME